MNSTVSTSVPFTTVRTRAACALGLRAVVLLAVAACLLTFGLNAFWRESYTGDEGFYGVTARNMLDAPSYWLRPSYFPHGDFMADKDGFAHPPFNSYLYAVGLWATRGSLVGPELVNLLALGLLLYAAYRVIARVDELGARIGVLLLAASPAMTGYYSMLEAEPLMTTVGLLGLLCCLRGGFATGGRRWLFAGGVCLGLAFALKLWLCGPLGLAMVAALGLKAFGPRLAALGIDDPADATTAPRWSAIAAGCALFAVGVVLPSALHLAAIAAFYPQDLGFWFKNIYFGIFTHAGISGSKFGGDAIPANWVHPVWYYGAALYRDHFFLLPPIVFGLVSAWRDGPRRRRLMLILAAGAAGVVPLSVIKVKEPLYVLTCAAFLYLLAALCLAALIRRINTGRDVDRASLFGGTALTAALMVLVPAAYVRGVQPDKLSLTFVVAHSVVFLVFLIAVFVALRSRVSSLLERTLYLTAATALAVTVSWAAVTHRPRDLAIARIAQPFLTGSDTGRLALIASNFKCYQYYTFAKGCYWHDVDRRESPATLLAQPEFSGVRVFILSPEDQQDPANAAWLHWLEANAVEKTAEVDRALGAVSGYRLYVREALTPRVAAR